VKGLEDVEINGMEVVFSSLLAVP